MTFTQEERDREASTKGNRRKNFEKRNTTTATLRIESILWQSKTKWEEEKEMREREEGILTFGILLRKNSRHLLCRVWL